MKRMKKREVLSLAAAFTSVILTFVAAAYLPMGWTLVLSFVFVLLALLTIDVNEDDTL